MIFENGENMKVIPINITNERVPKMKNKDFGEDEHIDDDETAGVKFKVILEKPIPQGVKISRKNCCTIEIIEEVSGEEAAADMNLLEFFVNQKNPTWGAQFKQAVMLSPTVDDDDMFDDVTLFEGLTHFATIGWKVLFALIPPCQWGGGKPAFIVALSFIGGITAIVAEVATVLGCTVGLKPAVTAITLVAVGTSLPDTFASMTAAKTSATADSAIGNVTGSNSVNVFVGLGLPWMISAVYASKNSPGGKYVTPQGSLAFSVMLFLITSITCFIVLGIRRVVSITYLFQLFNNSCFLETWRRVGR